MAFYIDARKNGSSGEIAYLLKKCILHCPKKWTEIVFLCIGSDRVTGDCLGPYIGHLLTPHETGHIFVYGTLSCPVHALNLEKTSSLIKRFHPPCVSNFAISLLAIPSFLYTTFNRRLAAATRRLNADALLILFGFSSAFFGIF